MRCRDLKKEESKVKKSKLIGTIKAVTFLAMTVCTQAEATGIPTVDAASLLQLAANAQQQAQQALAQLQAIQQSIAQAKSQYEQYKGLITGNNSGLGSSIYNSALNSALPLSGWQSIYSGAQNLAELRSRYGLTSTNPAVQAQFDQLLSQAGALESSYNAANERVNEANQLRQKLDTVQTPQQREDLNLRYQQEQIELQNQNLRLQNIKMLMDQQTEIEDKKNAQKMHNIIFGSDGG
jgi:type IV secretion system protein VirB5